MLLGNMDLSFLGVHAVWTNDLGKEASYLIYLATTLTLES